MQNQIEQINNVEQLDVDDEQKQQPSQASLVL